MKTFKQFIEEESGAVPVTTTSGMDNTNPPGPKFRKKKQHSEGSAVNYTGLSTVTGDSVVPLKPVLIDKKGKRTELGEDKKEEQKERDTEIKSKPGTEFATPPNKSENDPFSSETKKAIKAMTSHIKEEDDRYYRDESGKLRLKPEFADKPTPGWKRMEGGLKRKTYTGPNKSEWPKAADVLGKQQKAAAEEKLKEIQRKKEEKELAALIKRKKQEKELKKLQPTKTIRDINLGLKEESKNKETAEIRYGETGHLGFGKKGGAGFQGIVVHVDDDTGMIDLQSRHDPKKIYRGHVSKYTPGQFYY